MPRPATSHSSMARLLLSALCLALCLLPSRSTEVGGSLDAQNEAYHAGMLAREMGVPKLATSSVITVATALVQEIKAKARGVLQINAANAQAKEWLDSATKLNQEVLEAAGNAHLANEGNMHNRDTQAASPESLDILNRANALEAELQKALPGKGADRWSPGHGIGVLGGVARLGSVARDVMLCAQLGLQESEAVRLRHQSKQSVMAEWQPFLDAGSMTEEEVLAEMAVLNDAAGSSRVEVDAQGGARQQQLPADASSLRSASNHINEVSRLSSSMKAVFSTYVHAHRQLLTSPAATAAAAQASAEPPLAGGSSGAGEGHCLGAFLSLAPSTDHAFGVDPDAAGSTFTDTVDVGRQVSLLEAAYQALLDSATAFDQSRAASAFADAAVQGGEDPFHSFQGREDEGGSGRPAAASTGSSAGGGLGLAKVLASFESGQAAEGEVSPPAATAGRGKAFIASLTRAHFKHAEREEDDDEEGSASRSGGGNAHDAASARMTGLYHLATDVAWKCYWAEKALWPVASRFAVDMATSKAVFPIARHMIAMATLISQAEEDAAVGLERGGGEGGGGGGGAAAASSSSSSRRSIESESAREVAKQQATADELSSVMASLLGPSVRGVLEAHNQAWADHHLETAGTESSSVPAVGPEFYLTPLLAGDSAADPLKRLYGT